MGEYVLFAGQEIIPEPDALFQMVKAITEKKADMIYTDEDEISADGKHYSEPEFKPDFNLFRLRKIIISDSSGQSGRKFWNRPESLIRNMMVHRIMICS